MSRLREETRLEFDDSRRPKKSGSIQKEKRKVNRQARVATIIFTIIFLFTIGYYAYFIVNDSAKVVNNSYNHRIDNNSDTVIRGTIFSKNGKKLAYTDDKGTEKDTKDDKRVYPYGKSFSHVVGITTHGKYGLEKLCNYDLLSAQSSPLQKIINDFSNTVDRGCNVYTTLSTSLQKESYDLLGDNKGSVFIMNPSTGEIYTMTSRPAYDPETIDDIWDDLIKDNSDSRLVNRATQGKYIPGSIFKVATTLEYIRENKNYNDFSYYCDGNAKFKGFSINCFDGDSHGEENLENAFAYSCNSAFSNIGNKLNMKKFRNTASDLLFNSKLPLELDYNQSVFALKKSSSEFQRTQTAIGQGQTTVSPAHMAMIASAIANNGVLMKPYIIDYIENSNNEVISTTSQTEYKQMMTKAEAKQLKSYMSAVCDYGTGRIMKGSSYEAYGKTGTAEVDKKDHINSWFMGWAKKGKKKIAIAVVYEDVSEGSVKAVECAKQIFDNYFD